MAFESESSHVHHAVVFNEGLRVVPDLTALLFFVFGRRKHVFERAAREHGERRQQARDHLREVLLGVCEELDQVVDFRGMLQIRNRAIDFNHRIDDFWCNTFRKIDLVIEIVCNARLGAEVFEQSIVNEVSEHARARARQIVLDQTQRRTLAREHQAVADRAHSLKGKAREGCA